MSIFWRNYFVCVARKHTLSSLRLGLRCPRFDEQNCVMLTPVVLVVKSDVHPYEGVETDLLCSISNGEILEDVD